MLGVGFNLRLALLVAALILEVHEVAVHLVRVLVLPHTIGERSIRGSNYSQCNEAFVKHGYARNILKHSKTEFKT